MANSVLIVEDDREMLDILSTRLQRLGFDVTTAGGAEQALAAARQNEFDVALLDRRLSDQSGLQLMLELKSRMTELRAIILSGYADPEFEQEALDLGAFAYLRKPCRLAEIEATIERALASPVSARGETQ